MYLNLRIYLANNNNIIISWLFFETYLLSIFNMAGIGRGAENTKMDPGLWLHNPSL